MATLTAADSFIVFAPDVPEVEGCYPAPFDGERVGRWQNLGNAVGSARLGFGIDRLAPGEQSSFTHAHAHEEEFVYVLEGECAVRLVEPGKEPREVSVRAGHVISFVAGTGLAHCFVNRSPHDCRLLTVGERKREIERSFYAEDREYDAFFAREWPERHWAEGLALPVCRRTRKDYRVMPWKNGGGTTTELAIAPEAAGLERFLYRVSIAEVAADGPLSRFEGYDRHIMLLAGAGMTLECGANGMRTLSAVYEPRSFAGEWDVCGTLASGAVRDFNVIVDRARASSSLEVRLIELRRRSRATLAPHASFLQVFRRAGELGIFGAHYPKEHGGSGGDYWFSVAKAEEFPRCQSAGVSMGLIIKREYWQHKFVDLQAKLEAARALSYKAADMYNEERYVKKLPISFETVRIISMAKIFVGEVGTEIMDQCLQFHGGAGYIEEMPIARASPIRRRGASHPGPCGRSGAARPAAPGTALA